MLLAGMFNFANNKLERVVFSPYFDRLSSDLARTSNGIQQHLAMGNVGHPCAPILFVFCRY